MTCLYASLQGCSAAAAGGAVVFLILAYAAQPGKIGPVPAHFQRAQLESYEQPTPLGKGRAPVMDLKAQDSGRSLQLASGENVRIELGENPTTGYRWQILEDGAPVLRIVTDSFRRGTSAAVGGGGTRILEFHTEAAGATTLRLAYGRPGVPESKKQAFVLHITVK